MKFWKKWNLKEKYKNDEEYLFAYTLYFGEEYNSSSINISLCKSSFLFGNEITIGGENSDIMFWLSILGYSFYFGIDGIISDNFKRKHYERVNSKVIELNKKRKHKLYTYEMDIFRGTPRRIGFYISDEILSISIWKSDTTSRNDFDDFPWNNTGWGFSFLWKDKLFGQMIVEDDISIRKELPIYMPEGMYLTEVVMTKRKWSRERWPFKFFNDGWVWQTLFEFEHGLPMPGKKGTLYSLSPAVQKNKPTELEMSEYLVNRILMERECFGGKNWEPEDGWPRHCLPIWIEESFDGKNNVESQ